MLDRDFWTIFACGMIPLIVVLAIMWALQGTDLRRVLCERCCEHETTSED